MKLITPVARLVNWPRLPGRNTFEAAAERYGFSLKLSKHPQGLLRKLLVWMEGRGRPPLVHSYPQWEAPEDNPSAPEEELREVWRGDMRIIRNRRRARLLRKRGVPLMDLRMRNADGYHGPHAWAWFVDFDSVPAGTKYRKRIDRYLKKREQDECLADV